MIAWKKIWSKAAFITYTEGGGGWGGGGLGGAEKKEVPSLT